MTVPEQSIAAKSKAKPATADFASPQPEIITITSGKGGVGKTNLAVNLGIILSRRKQRVLIMDADLHLGKLDVILGASPQYTLAELVDGSRTIDEIILKHPSGIDILPASTGEIDLIDADERIISILADSFDSIRDLYDYLIIDTSAGLSPTVLTMALGADKVLLVITSEPASISDAYAMIKVISSKAPELPLILVPNRQVTQESGVDLHKKLNLITQKFLGITVLFGGSIVEDNAVRQAVIRQRPFVEEYPGCQASLNLQQVAQRLLRMQTKQMVPGTNIFDRFRTQRKLLESD